MLIRTARAAMLTNAAIVAFFTIEVVRTGLVMTAQNRGSLDFWVLTAFGAGALYAALFWFGHSELRRRDLSSRAAYAAIGAAAAIPSFVVAIGWRALASAQAGGTLSALLFCPGVAGALMGFLYHRRAGYDVEGDDLDTLVASASPTTGETGLIATETAEYFGGPLVVRTSFGANALAALLGSICFVLASSFGGLAEPAGSPMGAFMHANGPGLTLLQGMIGCAIPIALLLALAHGVLRAWRKHSYSAYAAGGAIGPAIFSLMVAGTGLSWFALAYLAQLWTPSLVAMLAYRRLAGLEPAPLPEDIEVSDRRTLVSEDHVRRRVARVVTTPHRG